MRENCTYGSMRGRAYPTTRGAPLYSTPHGHEIMLNRRSLLSRLGTGALAAVAGGLPRWSREEGFFNYLK